MHTHVISFFVLLRDAALQAVLREPLLRIVLDEEKLRVELYDQVFLLARYWSNLVAVSV